MTLRLFSDRSYLAKGAPHAVMLYPFWGQNPEDPGDPNSGRFDRYTETGEKFFRLASLEEADVAVLPFDWSSALDGTVSISAAEEFIACVRAAGKTTVVFFASDSAEPLRHDDVAVFRTSLYRSGRGPGEYASPAWSEDFVDRYLGRIEIRKRRSKPVVGFCGLPRTARPWLLRLSGRGSADTRVRELALRALQRDDSVETNFVIREHFLGGAIAGRAVDPATMQRVRREYVENMVESDYVLCARGAGNFSYRLYETLSCGRIPLFVDTNCVLPYDFLVDWRDYCVWIDEHDVDAAAGRLAEFHERLSDREFVELQHECRRFWERYLCPTGFFANFHRHLALPSTGDLRPEHVGAGDGAT